MADQKKLDRWADKLLDTGKRNNLISFKDTKASTAEIVSPECQRVFSKCSVGQVFEIYDPKIPDKEIDETLDAEQEQKNPDENKLLSRDEYIKMYASRLKNERQLLVFANNPNPISALKKISKKAQEMLDETGINVAYLAFGFLKWKEKDSSEVFYKAPLLLVHINILTGTIQDPVKIEVCDDDVVVNPTFDYLFQAEYGLNLPVFEDGDTLEGYYAKVAHAVRGLGWEILNECKIGVFSFLKINMYEDLKKNSEQILENTNVRALIGEAEPASIGVGSVEPVHAVDNPLIDLHTVVDADSSQIEAIEMAKSGKSFVLQGPPGTGKSQTITNIIAERLHDGKKILFVSEKQAALNVVFDKLKKAGLADFCLELHSHKANKKAVIDELNRTLEMPRSTVSANAQEEIRQKKEAQTKLDSYAAALHKVRNPINKSLYQLFEAYSAQRTYPEVPFTIKNIEKKGQDFLLQSVHLIEQYVEYIPSIGQDYHQNAWYGFIDNSIGFEGRAQLRADLETLAQGYRTLQGSTRAIKEKYETPELNPIDAQKWQSLLSFAAKSDVITPSILSLEALNYAAPFLTKMKESSETIVPLRNSILERYEESVIQDVDGKETYSQLTGEYRSFFSRLFSGEYKSLLAKLQMYVKGEEKVKYRDAVSLADQLMKIQDSLHIFNEAENRVPGCLGRCYRGINTDWDRVFANLETLRGYFQEGSRPFCAISNMKPDDFVTSQDVFRSDADRLAAEIASVEEAKARVTKQFAINTLNLESNSFDDCIRKIEGCMADFDKLGNWISFLALLDQSENTGLSPFIQQVIDARIEPEEITGAYLKSFYKQWIEYLIFSVPEIASFTRIKQDQAVKSFNAKDKIQYEISKIQIVSELSQQRPNLEMVAGGSAVAILRREAHKKRKQLPIRKLLSETGSLVQIIKPCFLMSPLSVSTFLDPEKISFDTVVFDEASQIFPQDAIGAIYRGKQLIVVGDSKQMPPSNFFNASTDIDDDEEIGDINDFESILDVCSSVFTTERLAWHYRSHYEQLIAFSNLHFYNNNLVTFPSASKDHKGIGVDFFFVGGTFDRKSKTNRAEAQFIVDLIIRNIEDYPDRSLGVVAFSVAQQNMIDQLLSKKREADPSYEWFFKADRAEPFFIKNLETVQGDERDTIIFSVAYAKDSQGRFIQNFGPLNREGGERRLNVAVTRAKDNVQLVSSIHYTDINLSNTGSEGVRLLRAYLDYAQNGEQALERMVTVSDKDQFDSYFEQEVCDYLRDQGYTVDTQVGCSGYRIDLGLRKPDSSNYLMAIECDGATYHSSRNARDRDSLRQRVLENMGWKFYRIWSTDWYRNKAVEKERLLKAAQSAMASGTDRTEETAGSNKAEKVSVAEEVQDRFVTVASEATAGFPIYQQMNALMVLNKHLYSMQATVRELIEAEGPLSEELLLKRIVSFFDKEKVSKTVLDRFNRKMYNCGSMGIIRRNGFLYLRDMKDIKFKIPGDRREIKYISIEELADGLRTLIEQNVSVSREGLYKTITNLLGFSRTTEGVAARYEEAIQLLKRSNAVDEADGLLFIKQ